MILLALAGDIMTGRGIDQCLPFSVPPLLQEPGVHDARKYVQLAEQKCGKIPRPLSYEKMWGQLLIDLKKLNPDLFVANLETSVTRSPTFFSTKEVHYRMHPKNISLLQFIQPCVFSLANNHLGDFESQGILETLRVLKEAGIPKAGAGGNLEEAVQPAVMDLKEKGRILLFSAGFSSSGIPEAWRAGENHPGVFFLEEAREKNVRFLQELVWKWKREKDLVLWSFHWGSNWGFEIPQNQKAFARKLIDLGIADLVHGHSSHHIKSFEVYRDKLILYGCGDLISDYEGITGYEKYHPELSVLFCPSLKPFSGELDSLALFFYKVKRFQIQKAEPEEVKWLKKQLGTDTSLER